MEVAWPVLLGFRNKNNVQFRNFHRTSQVVLVVKNPPANAGDTEMWVQSLDWEDHLKEGMATYSSILAWRIPRTEEPGRVQSRESQRIGHV